METQGPPSDAATYERARRLANMATWAVALQCRRIEQDKPLDGQFLLQAWTDFDFLVVALYRLRRTAALAGSVPLVP